MLSVIIEGPPDSGKTAVAEIVRDAIVGNGMRAEVEFRSVGPVRTPAGSVRITKVTTPDMRPAYLDRLADLLD